MEQTSSELSRSREGRWFHAAAGIDITWSIFAAPAARQLQQLHGIEVIGATAPHPARGDGWRVDPGETTPVAVRTADCVPVVVGAGAADPVLLLHIGWRGLTAGILDVLPEIFAASSEAVWLWLGPRICPRCFVIRRDAAAYFEARAQSRFAVGPAQLDPGWGLNAQQVSGSVDLCAWIVGEVSRLLPQSERVQVERSSLCTAESPQLPSYRRDGFCRAYIWTQLRRTPAARPRGGGGA